MAMHTTQWRSFQENGQRYRICATFGWHLIPSNKEPYFSITGEIQRSQKKYWTEDTCGCIHKDIEKHFPELKSAIRWHLVGKVYGPMHYVANAKYWWDVAHGRISRDKFLREEPISIFKNHVVFGALEDDKMPNENENIETWCLNRLPRLIELCHKEIEEVTNKVLF